MRLVISSRKSDLARLQSYRVAEALKAVRPDLELEFKFRESLGDKNLVDPLWKAPEKGLFTEDFYLDLVQGQTDLVVHSWKDLPTDEKSDTSIVATLPRADLHDVLLFKKSSVGKKNLTILSSSPRRAHNLQPFFKEFLPFPVESASFESVRGNVQTRARKLFEDANADGLIVAKAALDRLLLAHESDLLATREFLQGLMAQLNFMVLPLTVNPTAAAQGAIAIEVYNKRPDLFELLSLINDVETFACVQEERKILKAYGGGCHQKIGINIVPLPKFPGQRAIFLKGLTDQGEALDRHEILQDSRKQNAAVTCDWSSQQLALSMSRENLPYDIPEEINSLYVTRSESLGENIQLGKKIINKVIWVPGVKTWKKLAKRGVWVHGCQDGLGDAYQVSVQALTQREPRWARLTHRQAPETLKDWDALEIYTYQLGPIENWPNFNEFHTCFWTSGYLFQTCLEKFPDLVHKAHYCSPGRTYHNIVDYLTQRNLAKTVTLNVLLGPQD